MATLLGHCRTAFSLGRAARQGVVGDNVVILQAPVRNADRSCQRLLRDGCLRLRTMHDCVQEMHPFAKMALQVTPSEATVTDESEPDSCYIFPDGFAGTNGAGWAFVVLVAI